MNHFKNSKHLFLAGIVLLTWYFLASEPNSDNRSKTNSSETENFQNHDSVNEQESVPGGKMFDNETADEADKILKRILESLSEPDVNETAETTGSQEEIAPADLMQYEHSPSLEAAGRKLAGHNNENIRVLPIFIANHWRYFESPEFFSAMARLGCRFYIENQATEKLVAGINIDTGQFVPTGSILGLSPRKRLISMDSTVEQYLDSAKNAYGQGEYQLIMMVPLKMDYYLIGAMEDAVRNTDHHIRKFVCFYGRYEPFEKGMLLNIYKGKVMFSQGIKNSHVYVSLKMSYEDNYAIQKP